MTQTDKWEEFSEGEVLGYFHQDFPEYQIRLFEPDLEDENSCEDWVELHHKQENLVQKDSAYSRVSRYSNLFGWGKRFSIYIHSTPVYQDGALIRLYKVYCPYPNLLKSDDGRFQIRTNQSDSRGHRITYYVGAITFLKNRVWVHHAGDEPVGTEVFRVYSDVMRYHIGESIFECEKQPILVLDVDSVPSNG